MQTIFLHIGTGKTGTSFLQETFAENHDLLLDEGILYPKTGRADSSSGHHKLLPFLTDNVQWWMVNRDGAENASDILSKLISEIKQSGAEYTIVSEESLVWLPLEKINFLRGFLKDFTVKIVLDLRRQDDYVDSALNQAVKAAGHTYSFDQFWRFDGSWFVPNYYTQAAKWASQFSKESIIIRPYEKIQFFNNNIVNDFFIRTLGKQIDLKPTLSKKGENSRLTKKTLEFKRLLNWIFKDEPSASMRFLFSLYKYDVAHRLMDGNIISAQNRVKIYRSCVPHNLKIVEEFNYKIQGENALKPFLFIDEFRIEGITPFQGLTQNDILELLTFLKLDSPGNFDFLLKRAGCNACDEHDKKLVDKIKQNMLLL